MVDTSFELKSLVKNHWENETCGTRGHDLTKTKEFCRDVEEERYKLEPVIFEFANFRQGADKKLLEIGVGAGSDFINWVRNGAIATGIDLTEAAVSIVKKRLSEENLSANVMVSDAENLPFEDNSFDIVYSWGVLHHSPNTVKALEEVRRVLKPGGRALIMMYHVPSWTGWMLWGYHCFLRGRPWKTPTWAIANFLESPGTKAYTVAEGQELFAKFSKAKVTTNLATGDLLLMRPSAKYQNALGRLLWSLYPRPLIKLLGHRFGLDLLIEATK